MMTGARSGMKKPRERWTPEEHELFLEGLKKYHRDWRAVERHIGTKTAVQIRSHAQKFFAKAEKEPGTVDFDLPPPRPKRKPGAAAAAPTTPGAAGMHMVMLQPSLAQAGAQHTLFPSLLQSTGSVYPAALNPSVSTGTVSNQLPLGVQAPALDTTTTTTTSAAAATYAVPGPPPVLPSNSATVPQWMPSQMQQAADPAAAAVAAAAAAAIPLARDVSQAPAGSLSEPSQPVPDDLITKIAAAAVAAASTVAHAVIAAAGPQYVQVIEHLAQQDERLRFLTCPTSELVSNVATTTAVAMPQTDNPSPSVRDGHNAQGAPAVASNELGSSGKGSNSGGRTGECAAAGRSGNEHNAGGQQAQLSQPAPAQLASRTGQGASTAEAAVDAAEPAQAGLVDGTTPFLGTRPFGADLGAPIMNQMLGLPPSAEALPSIHTSDFLAQQDGTLPSLGLSGTLNDSNPICTNAAKQSRSLGTPAKREASASHPNNAIGDTAGPDSHLRFCSVPINKGAVAQAQLHAHQLEAEGSQGYGKQGSAGGGNGSGGSDPQPGSGGSGSKSGKHSGNSPTVPAGNGAGAAPSAHFQLLTGGPKPKSTANAQEQSQFYEQYYSEMIRRGTEGLRSIQQSLLHKAPMLPDFGWMRTAANGAAIEMPVPATKPLDDNAGGSGRQVGHKATAEVSSSPRHKRQRVDPATNGGKANETPRAVCRASAQGDISGKIMQSDWPADWEREQHDTATSGQHGPHDVCTQRDIAHRGTSTFSGPEQNGTNAAANGSDSGSNEPTAACSLGGTSAQGMGSREGSQLGAGQRVVNEHEQVAAETADE